MIQLNCPLVVLDTETTGPHPRVDRIIQIGLIKLYPDGNRKEWCTYVNPTIPIPPEAIEIHHITDEMVRDAPTFPKIAPQLAAGLQMSDYAGYNVDFDLRVIEAEFARITTRKFINGRVLDAFSIYRHYYPRSLSDAYREYTGKELEGAHDALRDSQATLEVIEQQLKRHADLPQTVEEIHRLYRETPQKGCVDPDGKLYWRNGEACLNFSDHAGTSLRQVDRGFLHWVLKKDFSDTFKQIVQNALDGKYPTKAQS